MATLAVQVERAVFLAVEVNAPFHELADLGRGVAHHLLDGRRVREPVSGHHRVVDMLLEVVDLEIGDRGHATLREIGIGVLKS